MRSLCVIAFLFVVGAFAGLTNKNVFRAIDIQGDTVYIRMNVTMENSGSDVHREIRIPVEYEPKKIAVFYASATAASQLPSTFDASDKSYVVTLSEPLRPGKTVQFSILIVLTHAVTPAPARAAQGAPQLVKYFDNHYFFSPYPTKEQTLHITTHGNKLEEYSKVQPTFAQGANLVCGPYRDVEPLKHHDLMIHFDDNVPFVAASFVRKELVVSHLDGIFTKEHYFLQNNAAEIDGFFSRYDMQMRRVQTPYAITALRCALPPSAHRIVYRDDIGNISTSMLNYTSRGVDLDIAPRFPMFGGWKIDFQVEWQTDLLMYSLPEKERVAGKGAHQLVVPVAPTMQHATIDKTEVRVALPEGATNVAVEVPEGVSWEMSTKPTYALLDWVGRPTVVFTASNLVYSLAPHAKIFYDYNATRLLLKPLIVAGYLVALVAFVMAVSHFWRWLSPKAPRAPSEPHLD